MAKLPDGTFYKVVGVTLVEARQPGAVAYQFYEGASLQAAEKRFDSAVLHCLHPEAPTQRRYMGLTALPRVELRFYQPDAKTYRVVKTWREDVPCQDIYTLLGRVNRPKALAALYGDERLVSDREYRAAEKAVDEMAPLLAQYPQIQFCYRDDDWASWHGHDCPCPVTG